MKSRILRARGKLLHYPKGYAEIGGRTSGFKKLGR